MTTNNTICPVKFDENTKVWAVPEAKNEQKINTNIGTYILKRLNELNDKNPNKIIEINHDDNHTWTVSDYRRLSITGAINLQKLGLKKGDVIIFFCTLNSYATVSVYAAYYLGVIVHPVDVNCTEDDFDYSLSIINPTVILCDDSVYNRVLTATKKRNPENLKYIFTFGESEGNKKSVKDSLFKTNDNIDEFKIPSDLGDPGKLVASLLSSSGSTGRPKVSMLPHTTLLYGTSTWWTPNEDSMVFCISLFRWISQTAMIIQCVHYGFCRIITGKNVTAELTAQIIHKHKITHIFGLPTPLVDAFEYAKEHKLNFDSLQVALTGGEITPDYLKIIGSEISPKCNIIISYGMTEIGRTCSSTEGVPNPKNSVGWLKDGFHVKIRDEKSLKPLGPNQKGQICIKVKNMFLGYWNNVKKTSETFDEDGWLLTGDFGYFDNDKLLYVVNRNMDIVRCNGVLIFPEPIERVLENHPKIAQAIVVGIPHKKKGQEAVVFIRLKPEFKKDENNDLKNDIEKYLIPKIATDQYPSGGIQFIDKFPLTFTGKVYREELRLFALKLLNRENVL